MSRNRIAENLFLLKSYDLVVNDLDLIDENSNLIQTKVWSDRFDDNIEDFKPEIKDEKPSDC
jgi:hypothetical protein